MKIAIVGGGIAGLTVARHLHHDHAVTLYEAGDYIGGHANTLQVKEKHQTIAIDSGFIVFNDWTYPHFQSLLASLGVGTDKAEMSFSAKCRTSGFEWCGSSISGLVFNRANWRRRKSYQILFDFLRFNRLARQHLAENKITGTLGEFLHANRFSQAFTEYYIIPMGAAIWSSTAANIYAYPAASYLNFFHNHGLLNIHRRLQWKTIAGGSEQYVAALSRPFADSIRLNCAVKKIIRSDRHIELYCHQQAPERFDHVFLACHSDQALSLLAAPLAIEKNTLGKISYQPNQATVHTDAGLMPSRRQTWSAWNYLLPENKNETVKVTYYMNRLQNLGSRTDYFVSLNCTQHIQPNKVIKNIAYMHPVFNQAAIGAQAKFSELNGVNNTWYCGAYWRYGFHEDGVWSALQALKLFHSKTGREHAQLYLQRAG